MTIRTRMAKLQALVESIRPSFNADLNQFCIDHDCEVYELYAIAPDELTAKKLSRLLPNKIKIYVNVSPNDWD